MEPRCLPSKLTIRNIDVGNAFDVTPLVAIAFERGLTRIEVDETMNFRKVVSVVTKDTRNNKYYELLIKLSLREHVAFGTQSVFIETKELANRKRCSMSEMDDVPLAKRFFGHD